MSFKGEYETHMKPTWVLIMILLVACNSEQSSNTDKNINSVDKTVMTTGKVSDTSTKKELPSEHSEIPSNNRFRDVEVKRIGEHQFQVTGKAQVFEATITYEIVKDKYACTYRGEIEAKNKGIMKMYFVEGA